MSIFRERLTIANTRPFLRHFLMKERDGNWDWNATLAGPINSALKAYLRDLRKGAGMAPCPDSEGHRVRFIDLWNRLATNSYRKGWMSTLPVKDVTYTLPAQDIKHLAEVIDGISNGPIEGLRRHVQLNGPAASEEEAYEALVSALERGQFDFFDPSDCRCDVYAQRYRVTFDGWAPTAHEFRSRAPMEAIPPEVGMAAVHAEVEFPSGHLLITDVFALKEFVDRVRPNRTSHVSADLPRAKHAKELAEEEGIVHVFHEFGPNILPMDNGGLNFVQFSEVDDHRMDLTDRPNSDTWAVSVIDRETFVNMLFEDRGCEREVAEAAVDAFLEEHQDIIHRQVEPGTYHLYFGTNDEVNLDAYDIAGVDQDGLEEILILSPEPLELTPKEDGPLAPKTGHDASPCLQM